MILIEEKQTKKLPGLTSLFISFNYNPLIIETIKSFAIYQYLPKDKVWELPITLLSQLINKLCVIDSIQLKLLKDKKNTYQCKCVDCGYVFKRMGAKCDMQKLQLIV